MRIGDLASKYVFYPLWDIYDKSSKLKAMRSLERNDHASLAEKKAEQWQKLRAIIDYAAAFCPYYRERGYSSPESLADFARVPLLQKADIRQHQDRLISEQFRKGDLIQAKTGGSTGTSLVVWFDRLCQVLRNAAALRCDKWSGWDLGKPQGCLWGNPIEAKTLKHKIRNTLLDRVIYLDTVKLSDTSMGEFCGSLAQRQIHHVFGHAHSLYILARFIEAKKIGALSVEGVISTSMMLLPQERKVIEKVFNCKVTDRYGCEELGLIACECEKHEGMHLNIDHLFIEFIKQNGSVAKAGEEGTIVVTDLVNHGMPLIRYVVGDAGVPTDRPCSCGRGLPLMEKVVGRTADFLVTQDGRMVAGVSLVERTLTAIRGLEQLQIVQDKMDDIKLNVVPDPEYGPETEKRLLEEMRKALGVGIDFKIVKTARIEPERNGKHRFSICRVSSLYQQITE